MKTRCHEIGLLSVGSDGLWQIDIDEDDDVHYMQIESPWVEIYFQIRDLKVVSEMLNFIKLRTGLSKEERDKIDEFSMVLNENDHESVSLNWDEEYGDFIIWIMSGELSVRVPFDGDCISNIINALNQIKEDLEEV